MKNQEFGKMRRGLGTYRTSLNVPTSELQGARGEEEEQKIKHLFEQITKENFPNLAKEKTSRKSRKLRESQRSWTQRGTHQSQKQQEKRTQLPTKEFPLDCQLVLKRDLTGKKGLARSIPSDEKQGPTFKVTLSNKAIIHNQRAGKVLPRQGKAKGVHHHQAIIT